MLPIQRDRPQPDLPSPRPTLEPRRTRRQLRGGQPPRRTTAQRGTRHRPGSAYRAPRDRDPVRRDAQRRNSRRARPAGQRAGEARGRTSRHAGANAADALYRCHRALELDGLTHSYTADEWLPVIYDIAGQLLESSHLDQEPPTLVQQTQDAVRWLSASIARLDEDSRDAAAALADTLARLLVVCVFVDGARASAPCVE